MILELFMNDFILFFCFTFMCDLKKVLIKCKEKWLLLNWEKCHFVVISNIVVKHMMSSKCI